MKKTRKSEKWVEFYDYITHEGIEYVRKENIYFGENGKEKNYHTIMWRKITEGYPLVVYFSEDVGWSKDGKMDLSNPIPELEKIFRETFGKSE